MSGTGLLQVIIIGFVLCPDVVHLFPFPIPDSNGNGKIPWGDDITHSTPVDYFGDYGEHGINFRSLSDVFPSARPKKTIKYGRNITYYVSGRIHSPLELWVYDCTARDDKTLVDASIYHVAKRSSCINLAIQRLFKELELRHLLQVTTTVPVEYLPTTSVSTPVLPVFTTKHFTSSTTTVPYSHEKSLWPLYCAVITFIGVLIAIGIYIICRNSKRLNLCQRKFRLLIAREPTLLGAEELGATGHANSGTNASNSESRTNGNEPADKTGNSEVVPVHRIQTKTGEFVYVYPDKNGYYTHLSVGEANPEMAQLNPRENYATYLSQNKGLVFILNNNCFSYQTPDERLRKGSEVDVTNVQHVFQQIGYEPVVYHNLSADEIRTVLESLVHRINAEGATRHSSVVLVLMGQGQETGILGTDEQMVTLDEIMDTFSAKNCPSLVNKPKMMFIQACRAMSESGEDGSDSEDAEPCFDDIPLGGENYDLKTTIETDGGLSDSLDVFIAFATLDVYFSMRDGVHGSWFIQALCEELIAKAHEDDLDTMMNRVTRRVGKLKVPALNGKGKKRDMMRTPYISKHGIRKIIHFMPKYPRAVGGGD